MLKLNFPVTEDCWKFFPKRRTKTCVGYLGKSRAEIMIFRVSGTVRGSAGFSHLFRERNVSTRFGSQRETLSNREIEISAFSIFAAHSAGNRKMGFFAVFHSDRFFSKTVPTMFLKYSTMLYKPMRSTKREQF